LLAHQVRAIEQTDTVFRDSLPLSRYDVEHSEAEERWLYAGQDNGRFSS
jgi:hypothetical protein